jgi:cytosine/adenosine deaminase-related metal-dependent hydrolase
MAYRKFSAEQVFDGYQLLHNKVVVFSDNGVVQDVLEKEQAGEDVEQHTGILSPGFVNCHCHLELSHMRGVIPQGTGLVDFVLAVVKQRHFPEEEILTAISTAEAEMKEAGMVAVGDICNTVYTIAQKSKSQLHYHNFIEASGWLPQVANTRLDSAKKLLESFANLEGSPSSIVPHAPYSVSAELWQQLKPLFKNNVVSIHNQESAEEDLLFAGNAGDFTRMYQLLNMDNAHHKATGKSSLQSYFDKMQSATNILLVHNTFITEEDVAFVQRSAKAKESFFCLNINANQYIENAVPPIDLLRDYGCTITLGTDSLASNWSLNIMGEIKTIQKFFPSIGLAEMLQWATINGAKALQMDAMLGSFEQGKTPGLVFIQPDNLTSKRIF